MALELRHAIAGGVFVTLDKGFDIVVTWTTHTAAAVALEHSALMLGVMFGAGIAVAALFSHGAHKAAEKHERKHRVVIEDWRDL